MKFRRLREMRPEAPASALVQARELSGPAEQMMLAQRGAVLAQRAAVLARTARAWGADQGDPDFEPIADVGLEQFAAISRGIAAFGHDQSKLAHVTAAAGIPLQHWEAAARGWPDRIQGNHAVARRFNQFYWEVWA
jgi:hypothetical protein